MILNRATPIPLTRTEPGGDYLVEDVSGPEQQRLRLCELGVVAGVPIAVLSGSREGALVVKIGNCRMGLSRDLIEHIWVRSSAPPPDARICGRS